MRSKLITQQPSRDTLYPVTLPGHVWVKKNDPPPPATLYFTHKQLVELRATVAAAIVKSNKHRMESR